MNILIRVILQVIISGNFNQELENVRNHVLAMGGLVEQQLNSALDAVNDNNAELAKKVEIGDYKVNPPSQNELNRRKL